MLWKLTSDHGNANSKFGEVGTVGRTDGRTDGRTTSVINRSAKLNDGDQPCGAGLRLVVGWGCMGVGEGGVGAYVPGQAT